MARKKSHIRRNRILILVGAVLLGSFCVTLVRQEFKMWELHQEERQIQKQADDLNREIAQLKEDVAASESSGALEKAAREKLKMVRSDEIVYVIKDPPAATKK